MAETSFLLRLSIGLVLHSKTKRGERNTLPRTLLDWIVAPPVWQSGYVEHLHTYYIEAESHSADLIEQKLQLMGLLCRGNEQVHKLVAQDLSHRFWAEVMTLFRDTAFFQKWTLQITWPDAFAVLERDNFRGSRFAYSKACGG